MLDLPPPTDDQLATMAVKDWSQHKHYFLRRYIDAFTKAMHSKGWSALNYIDLFAGPGILRLESTGELEWGSPLIAALSNGFDNVHACELNPAYYEALAVRLERVEISAHVNCVHGDANQAVQQIVDSIPQRSLSVAFLDPHGLHLRFETLQLLARHRVDLIIFFPDHLDALRNCEYVYEDQPDSNLDQVLGPGADWRSLLRRKPRARWAEALRELYVQQLRTLGYSEFEYERIYNRGSPLYLLIFCSHHPAGSKIWRGTSQMKPDGQRTWDFG